jgi:hypothetical protein
LFHPNKHELWLHWALAESRGARFAILRRRLLPAVPPGPAHAVHTPESQLTPRIRLQRRWRYLALVGSRAAHHAQALLPTLWSGVRWFGGRADFSAQFWSFFAAACLYDFGLSIFFLRVTSTLAAARFRRKYPRLRVRRHDRGSLVASIPTALVHATFSASATLCSLPSGGGGGLRLRASTATTVPLRDRAGFRRRPGVVGVGCRLLTAIAQLTTELQPRFGIQG